VDIKMTITLDNLATRYHCLPSYALEQATTFDLHVLDVATRWHNYQQEFASTGKKPVPKLSEDAMMQMLKNVKGTSV
jgi:hypothetical protein